MRQIRMRPGQLPLQLEPVLQTSRTRPGSGTGWTPVLALGIVLLLAACGRDREVLPVPEAPGPKTRVALSPLELREVADFDRLDRQVLAAGGPADLVQVYNDLARVAPNDPRVLVRGALAALAADPQQAGQAVAEGVLARLAKDAPGNADAAWLALRATRLRLAPVGQSLKSSSDSQAEALRALARDAADFATRHPDWKGPFGATIADARRTAADAEAAVATYETAKAAAATPDATTGDDHAPSR